MKVKEEKENMDQRISLISEQNNSDRDEREDEGLKNQRPIQNERHRGRWRKLAFWRRGQTLDEGVESEALMPSGFGDDEGLLGGGDISTSDLVYQYKTDNEIKCSTSDYNDDGSDEEEDTEENLEAIEEDNLLILTDVPTKNHKVLNAAISPTSVMASLNGESSLNCDSSKRSSESSSSDCSESRSDSSSESSSEDGSVVRKHNHVDLLLGPLECTSFNSNDNSDDSSLESEIDDSVPAPISTTGRPALDRRCASTMSFFDKKDHSSKFSQSSVSRSQSMRSGFCDNGKEDDYADIDSDGRRRLNGRIEGFGSSLSPESKSSSRTLRQRLQSFRNGSSEMKKMSMERSSSWTTTVESRMNDIIDVMFVPPELRPFEEGYMIASRRDRDVIPTSKGVNPTKSNDYIARIERELRQKDLEITCWKNRVKELEKEINRLKEVIDEETLLNNVCGQKTTEIEWQSEEGDLLS